MTVVEALEKYKDKEVCIYNTIRKTRGIITIFKFGRRNHI